MVRLRYKLIALAFLLVCVFIYGRFGRNNPLTNGTKPAILKPGDKEEIRVDPVHHTISVTTSKGTTVTTLPDAVSDIEIGKDDNVKITAPQFGFEHHPFVYAGYSNALRWGAGVDGLYFKKLDLGVGLAGGSGTNAVVFVKLSYNVFDNVGLGVTLDHQEHIGVGVSIRI